MSKTLSYFKPFHELASIFHSPFLPFQGSESCKTAMTPAIILFFPPCDFNTLWARLKSIISHVQIPSQIQIFVNKILLKISLITAQNHRTLCNHQ